MTATCIVRRWLLGDEQLSVQVAQGQKHHDVSSRGELKAAVTASCVLCFLLCASLTAWLLFMAGARTARGKGDRRGLRL